MSKECLEFKVSSEEKYLLAAPYYATWATNLMANGELMELMRWPLNVVIMPLP